MDADLKMERVFGSRAFGKERSLSAPGNPNLTMQLDPKTFSTEAS
jgi:hypothetical protein